MPAIPFSGVQLVYIMGITNIVFMVLTLFSCRCRGFGAVSEYLLPEKIYRKFYRAHCFYWWGFIISVMLHTFFAFTYLGNPL